MTKHLSPLKLRLKHLSLSPTQGDCSGRWGFAIFVGVITTLVAGTQIGLHFFMADLANKIALYVGLVLFVTWMFGAGFNTSSSGPFPYTGNGYLASCMLFVCIFCHCTAGHDCNALSCFIVIYVAASL